MLLGNELKSALFNFVSIKSLGKLYCLLLYSFILLLRSCDINKKVLRSEDQVAELFELLCDLFCPIVGSKSLNMLSRCLKYPIPLTLSDTIAAGDT